MLVPYNLIIANTNYTVELERKHETLDNLTNSFVTSSLFPFENFPYTQLAKRDWNQSGVLSITKHFVKLLESRLERSDSEARWKIKLTNSDSFR